LRIDFYQAENVVTVSVWWFKDI